MSYFHSRFVRSRGGLRSRAMRRVAAETLEEMQRLHRLYPEATKINWPPRGSKAMKSKSLPMIWVEAARPDILEEIGSVPVPETYILVLTWLLRREFWAKWGGRELDGESFFTVNIRGGLIQLLRAGDWIDNPESLSLEKLNYRLEKIDLGRRSDLNFSSRQSEIQKYDQDFRRREKEDTQVLDATAPNDDYIPVDEPETEMDWNGMYRDGSSTTRKELWETRPWMRSQWKEKYGEP